MNHLERALEYLRRASTLLIDLDGTLVDSSASVTRAWNAWGKKSGVASESIFQISEGRQGNAVIADLRPDLDSREEDLWLIAHQLADVADVVPIPGAIPFLAQLKDRRWAIVTSCPRDLALARLNAAGIPHPEWLICADDVPRSKPHPDGFQLAMSRLNVTPDQCVVFEDSEAGLEAARRAGIASIAIHHASRCRPPADQVAVADWTGLIDTAGSRPMVPGNQETNPGGP